MNGEFLSLETAEKIANYTKRNYGEHTTLETRQEAYESVDKTKRYKEILECLSNKQMTAKEIANEMWLKGYIPTNERNFTAPRLNELAKKGIVDVIGKKKCKYSGKSVSVYEVKYES